jgi:aspartate/methionine/tyrosine aminotransferase
MRRFPPTPITRLVDEAPRYNLGESYCQELTLDELLGSHGSDGADRLAQVRLGYRTSAGERELRRLIAANAGVADDQVLVTSGAASALFLLGLLFGDGDQEIVVVQPCFPPTLAALRGIDARVVTTPLRFEDGYRLDLPATSDRLNSRTRLVMLSSPQNPSGVAFTQAEIEQLLAMMSRRCPEALLLVDEVYRESVYGQAPVPASFASLSPRVVTCASLSKSHGAAGLRIGWLTVQDHELYDQLRLAKFNAAISCGALDEVLAVELLRRAESLLAPRRAFLAEALAVVEAWVQSQSGLVRWVRPDAGAICCIQLDPATFGQSGMRRFYAALADRQTSVAPGEWFGDGPNVFRLGFGYEPMDKLKTGLEMISDALQA